MGRYIVIINFCVGYFKGIIHSIEASKNKYEIRIFVSTKCLLRACYLIILRRTYLQDALISVI